jgi:xylulokinase
LLKITGLEREKLPDLIRAVDILGTLKKEVADELGLKADTPVIGGTPDVPSACVGSGAVRNYEGHLYIGTSSWISAMCLSRKPMSSTVSDPFPAPFRAFI